MTLVYTFLHLLWMLHILLQSFNIEQFSWTQPSQSLPNTAVTLIKAMQSASAPCDWVGAQPNKYLWRFINENDAGMLEKLSIFLGGNSLG